MREICFDHVILFKMAARGLISSFRHEGHMFFIYDHCKKSEEDDPKDAILYFYPRTFGTDDQVALVGGIIGLADFCLEFMPQSVPSIMKLSWHNFALLQHENFIVGLSGSPDIPDKFLIAHLQFVWSTFVFYQGSLEAVKERVSANNFVKELNHIWDLYLPLCQMQGDTLSHAFQVLPYVQLSKSEGNLFLHASHILQRSLRHKGVLAGAVFSKKKVLCTQLSNSLTRQLLLLMSHSGFPCYEADSFLELPGGVRLLYVYLPQQEYSKLSYRRQKSYSVSTSIPEKEKTSCDQSARKTSVVKSPTLISDETVNSDNPHQLSIRTTSKSSMVSPISGTDSEVFMDTVSEISYDPQHNLKLSHIQQVECSINEDKLPTVKSDEDQASTGVAPGSVQIEKSPLQNTQVKLEQKEEKPLPKTRKSIKTRFHTKSPIKDEMGDKGNFVNRESVKTLRKSENGLKDSNDIEHTHENTNSIVIEKHKRQFDNMNACQTDSGHFNGDYREDIGNDWTQASKEVAECTSDHEQLKALDNDAINNSSDPVYELGIESSALSSENCKDNVNQLENLNHALSEISSPHPQGEEQKGKEDKSSDLVPNSLPELGKEGEGITSQGVNSLLVLTAQQESASQQWISKAGTTTSDQLQINPVSSSQQESDDQPPKVIKDSSLNDTEVSDFTSSSYQFDVKCAVATISAYDGPLPNASVTEDASPLNSPGTDTTLTSVSYTFSGSKSEEKANPVKDTWECSSNQEIDDALVDVKPSGDDSSNCSSSELRLIDNGSTLSLVYGEVGSTKDRLTFEPLDSDNSDESAISPVPERGCLSPVIELRRVTESEQTPIQSGLSVEENIKSETFYKTETVGGTFSNFINEGLDSQSKKTSTPTKWDLEQNGLQEMILYAQGHSDSLLLLLISRNTKCSKAYIHSLWKTCLTHLAELDFQVKDAERHVKDESENIGATYQYLRYDSFTQSIKGSALLPVTSLANEIVDSSIKMHESFMEMPDLHNIIYRSHSASCYGHRNVNSETYFQIGVSRTTSGIGSPGDKTFSLEQLAEKVLQVDGKLSWL